MLYAHSDLHAHSDLRCALCNLRRTYTLTYTHSVICVAGAFSDLRRGRTLTYVVHCDLHAHCGLHAHSDLHAYSDVHARTLTYVAL